MCPQEVTPSQEAFEPVFVARQPVFDSRMRVWGYELLFRNSGTATKAVITDPNAATLQMIADGVAVALPTMEPEAKVLINFPRALIVGDVGLALPPNRCIIEILETVEPDAEVLQACRRLKQAGYKLALDDFVGQPGYEPLVAMADIIKFDCLLVPPQELERVLMRMRFNGLKLAEKVEDRAVFDAMKRLGFHFFQGFFFSKPELLTGRKISSGAVSKLRLISELSQPEFDPKALAKIIQVDASLSHRLFRYVNSVAFGTTNKVTSVSHALSFLGEVQARKWLRVVLMTDLSTNPAAEELLFLSAQRGRFLELLATRMPKPPFRPDGMFLLGLFSLLDSLLGTPMEELVAQLPIEANLREALTNPKSPLRVWPDLAVAQERGRWDVVSYLLPRLGLDAKKTALAYGEAMAWAQEVLKQGQQAAK